MKNRSFTGKRQSVGTPTLNKNSYFQLIRQIRKKPPVTATTDGKTADVNQQKGHGENNTYGTKTQDIS